MPYPISENINPYTGRPWKRLFDSGNGQYSGGPDSNLETDKEANTVTDITGGKYEPIEVPGGKRSADQVNAELTRRQWEEYLNTYAHHEERILQDLMWRRENIGMLSNQAGQRAGEAFDVSAQISDRDLSRYRASLKPGQAEALKSLRAHQRARTSVGANNLSRRSLSDSVFLQQAKMSHVGSNLSGMAQDTAGQLLGLETQRRVANRQIQARRRGGIFGFLGDLLS